MKRLVIIDGKSVFYRGYYAMGALSKSDGTPTGGIYGFAAIAMEIVQRLKPTKVVVAWDSKSSTAKRKALYSEYKAGRVKPGDDFYAQIPYLKKLVLALGWGFVECEGYEADDIIGTLALQADLLSSGISLSEPPVRGSSTSSTASLRASSLPRTASKLTAPQDSDPRQPKNNLQTTKDSSVQGQSPDTRDSFVQGQGASGDPEEWETIIVSSDLDMLQVVDENTRMYRILKGFSKLEELDVAAVEEKYGIKKVQFLDLKALKGDASDNIPGVPGVGEKTAVKLLREFGDLEGIYAHLDEIQGKVREKLEAGKDSAFMSYELAKIMTDAPVRLEDLPDLKFDQQKVIAALDELEFRSLRQKFFKKPEFASKVAKIGDQKALGGLEDEQSQLMAVKPENAREGQKMAKKASLADYSQQVLEVVQEAEDGTIISWDIKNLMHKNTEVAERILAGAAFWDLGQGAFLLSPLTRLFNHGDEKTEYARQLVEFQALPELKKVLTEFDLPLIPVLYQMEAYGMLISREHFAKLKAEFEQEVRGLEQRIWELAGKEFNVNSPVQLAEVLFVDLRLPTKGIKKTARGYSTGAKELDKLEGMHEIIGVVKEYREAAKLLSTYIAPLPELADKHGRIHTTYNQNVTATGRLSSTNPNLQNIPVRTEVGKRIREGFIAPEGRMLVSADYSQFELRLAAALSNDKALIEDFNSGVDIHTKTAAEAFMVPIEEVTKTQRRAAKVINFGILYGMSVRGLAQAADMSYADAKAFIEQYFALRKPIKEYLDKLLVEAREKGYVETLFGRRRPTPDVLSTNYIVRTGAERAAQNMPIQGTEADLMKRAMIKVYHRLAEKVPSAKMVVQVHDSLVIECDEQDVEAVSEILRQVMENEVAPELAVRLGVDVTVGQNWGEV